MLNLHEQKCKKFRIKSRNGNKMRQSQTWLRRNAIGNDSPNQRFRRPW
nr:MAG TPA: hypothetical protein [Caudoviricetes sp.]